VTDKKRGETLKIYKFHIYLLIIISLIISGCSAKTPPYTLKPNYDQNPAKIIAVLPIENKTVDGKTSQLLRSRMFEELYFKGYPKLQLDIIDKKLESLYSNGAKESAATIAPQALKDLVGADAGLYCTLMEGNKSEKLFYVPITIAIRCELRSTQTGEVLWNAQGEYTSRNFDFTHNGLERKSHEVLETVIDEVINRVIKTLPDGPNLRG
jgi:hypothetical protein